MRRLTGAMLILALAACAGGGGGTVSAFRPAAAPIWSAAAFAPERIEGRWTQAAAYSAGAGAGCRAGGAEITRRQGGLFMAARLCLDGREVAVSGPMAVSGPGRLSIPGMEDWWVIWVDSGYRTLAVATPSGKFGFVLDRGEISSDRLVAAAEIFEFNGYSKARLKPF